MFSVQFVKTKMIIFCRWTLTISDEWQYQLVGTVFRSIPHNDACYTNDSRGTLNASTKNYFYNSTIRPDVLVNHILLKVEYVIFRVIK